MILQYQAQVARPRAPGLLTHSAVSLLLQALLHAAFHEARVVNTTEDVVALAEQLITLYR